jgi:hypothetical protein
MRYHAQLSSTASISYTYFGLERSERFVKGYHMLNDFGNQLYTALVAHSSVLQELLAGETFVAVISDLRIRIWPLWEVPNYTVRD